MDIKHRKYLDVLRDPEGLTAVQNTIVPPLDRVPLIDVLLVVERELFPNFLCDPENALFRRYLSHDRLFADLRYRQATSEPKVSEAEKQRGRALEFLRDPLIDGVLKGYLLCGDGSELTLAPEWWRSNNCFNIDGLGYFWESNGLKLVVAGTVFLERNNSERWCNKRPIAKRGTLNPEAKCELWLRSLMDDGKPRLKPRHEYEQEALNAISGLSARGFGRAWVAASKAVNNPAWIKAGAPRGPRAKILRGVK